MSSIEAALFGTLGRDAERDGLIEQIGQDQMQKILDECFASYR